MIISDETGKGIGMLMKPLLDPDLDADVVSHVAHDTDAHVYTSHDGKVVSMEFGDWGMNAPADASNREVAFLFAGWVNGYLARMTEG